MMKKCLYAGMLGWLGLVPLSYAGDDSSADVDGFGTTLAKAPAVMLAVAIDASGNEDSASAELHVHTGAPLTSEAEVGQAFDASVDASSQPQITDQDIAADSSTHGFYRYHGGAKRWVHPYYYRTYHPAYYNRGYYYYYNYPSYYYTNWGRHFRYYYYPRRYYR